MRANIHLRFSVDVDDVGDAWDICEKLEKAALKQNYVGISSWVENDGSLDGLLVPEGEEPITSEAMRLERGAHGEPTGVGDAEGVLTPQVFGQED